MVSILFARTDSNYKYLTGVDVWDMPRDARRWPGGNPVVAHPPCRAWGRLRQFARPRPDEAGLALWAVQQVRQWGGVLEHPQGSLLWQAAHMPPPGMRDAWGGWTLPIHQHWWGHRAQKSTWLYIVGCDPRAIPAMPIVLGQPTHVVASRCRGRPEITKAEREHTPLALAMWLVELASHCTPRSAP